MKNLLLLSTLIMAFGAFAQELPKARIEIKFGKMVVGDTSSESKREYVSSFVAQSKKAKACVDEFMFYRKSILEADLHFNREMNLAEYADKLPEEQLEIVDNITVRNYTKQMKLRIKHNVDGENDYYVLYGDYKRRLENGFCLDMQEKMQEVLGDIHAKTKKEIEVRLKDAAYELPGGLGTAPEQDDSFRGNQKEDFIQELYSAPAGSQVQDA